MHEQPPPVRGALFLAAIVGATATRGHGQSTGHWDYAHGDDWCIYAVHAVHTPMGQVLMWDECAHLPVDPECGPCACTICDSSGESATLWDPLRGTFTPAPNCAPSPCYDILCAGHAGLEDGSFLVAGASETSQNQTKLTHIFTAGGTWILKNALLSEDRYYPTLTTLANGQVLAVGGTQSALGGPVENPVEVYDPALDEWTVVATGPFPTCSDECLPFPPLESVFGFYPFTFLLPNGSIAVVGANQRPFSSGDPVCVDTLLLDLDLGASPPTGTWTSVQSFPQTFSAEVGSAVMYEPGKVLKCGGIAFDCDSALADDAIRRTARIDFNGPEPNWVELPQMTYPRKEHNLVILADGRVLAVGGKTSGQPFDGGGMAIKHAERIDPRLLFPLWTELAEMTHGRAHHSTALLLSDGKVLSAGETHTIQESTRGEIFTLPEDNLPAPVMSFVPAVIRYGTTFAIALSQFSPVSEDAIDQVTLLRLGAATHGFDQNQRFVPLSFTDNPLTPGLEATAPPTREIAPPGYYMLFVVSNQMVPSKGFYVQLTGHRRFPGNVVCRTGQTEVQCPSGLA